MLSQQVFSKGLFALSEVYNRNISDTLSEIYYDVLQELTDEQFKNAVNKIIRTNKYPSMPKPAEILEYVHGKPQDEALNAWNTTLEAIRHIGAYKTPIFEDKAISATIEHLGGWIKLCDTDKEEMIWVQKEFEKFYPIMKRKNNESVMLCGITEQTNANLGYEKNEKVLIGREKEKILDFKR